METQAAHILPHSLNTFKEEEIPVSPFVSTGYAMQAHALDDTESRIRYHLVILRAWAPALDVDGLMGEGIDQECNALTLSSVAHRLFGQFELWLEATVSFLC